MLQVQLSCFQTKQRKLHAFSRSRYVTAADGKEGFIPYVYCAPQGTASTDDIHVGAHSSFFGAQNNTSATAALDAHAAAATMRRWDQTKHIGTLGSQATGTNNINYKHNNLTVRSSPKNLQNRIHVQNASVFHNNKALKDNQTVSFDASASQSRDTTSRNFLRSYASGSTDLNGSQLAQNAPLSQSYTRGPKTAHNSLTSNPNTTNSFNASSTSSNSNRQFASQNSSRNENRPTQQQSNDDYLSMDNRSRFARFQNHRYENVHFQNGLRGQGRGHTRHSSEDRSYGKPRQSQIPHSRYHSLDRTGYGGYRPPGGAKNLQQQSRQRSSSQDAQIQRARYRSTSRESHQSRLSGQMIGNTNLSGQSYKAHNQPLVASTRENASFTLKTQPGSNRNNANRIQGHSRGQGFHQGRNRSVQQELDSVGSWMEPDRSSASDTPLLDSSEVTSFVKRPHGRYIVLFPFTGQVRESFVWWSPACEMLPL